MGHDSRYEKIVELFLKKKFYISFFVLLPFFFAIFALGPSFVLLGKINSAMEHQAVSRDELISIYNFSVIWTLILSAGALVAGIAVAYSILKPVKKLIREGTEDMEEFGSLGKDFSEMASSFRHYFTIMENISGGIITIDNNKVVRMANRQACNIFECNHKDFIGKNLMEKTGDISEILKKVFEDRVESGDIIYSFGGREKIIGYTASPITGGNGVEGAVFNLKDITGIREIQERIKHTERLASIGTLAREIAHEIRNPLTSIKGITQMLGEELDRENPRKKYIELVLKEIDRLNRVVDNLLEKGKNEMVSLKEILHRTVLLCSQNTKWERVRVIEEYDETLEMGNIDESLSKAFYNVILNAFESVDKDGEVIVRAKNDKKSAVIEIISSSVISEDNLKRIFDEGFTTKTEGHGMGLKISMDAVRKAGGNIKVEPSEKSTKFSIILPEGV